MADQAGSFSQLGSPFVRSVKNIIAVKSSEAITHFLRIGKSKIPPPLGNSFHVPCGKNDVASAPGMEEQMLYFQLGKHVSELHNVRVIPGKLVASRYKLSH